MKGGGRKIQVKGYKLGKRGLQKVSRDASAKKRETAGGSKRIRYTRGRGGK